MYELLLLFSIIAPCINPRKRELSNYSTINLVDGTTSEARFSPNHMSRSLRSLMYYSVLDIVLPSLKDRVNQSGFLVYENIESFTESNQR